MRKLATSIKKRIDRLIFNRFRVVKRSNSFLLVDNRNWIDARIIVRKPYEAEQLKVCADIIRRERITTFIDVGANFGLYSVVLNNRISLKKTYAFEPVIRNYFQMCGNIFINQLQNRVIPIQKALSNKNNKMTIHVDPSSTGVSRLSLENSGRNNKVFSYQEQIECVTLDSEINLSGEKIFIKIDVEGHELEALQGMVNTLKSNNVFLQIEAFGEKHLAELHAFLIPFGYAYDGCIGSDHRFSNFCFSEKIFS